MNGNTYDVVIIGGGVIGSSIARALSKYECRTVLLAKRRGCLLRHIEGKQCYRPCGL